MARNSSHFSSFILSAYTDPGPFRPLLFCSLLLLYLLTLFSNILLVTVVCLNRSLHEPMYIFLCSLLLNEVFGSTALIPFLLLQILKTGPVLVPWPSCFLQVFCLHSYGLIEYLILASMSYDRYIAVCHPLQYNTYMTRRRIAALIGGPCLYTFLVATIMILLSSSLRLCANVIPKMYCDNYPIVKLACEDTTSLNIYSLFIVSNNIVLPLVVISWTYGSILKVCLLSSRQTRHKALSTCGPHIASLLNYTMGSCFEVLQGRFDMSSLPNQLRVFLSLYFLLFQPLCNPLMYGLALSKIRRLCKSLLLRSTANVS